MAEKLGKSSFIFSSLTFLSRIFGYIRDMIIAYQFGTSPAVDAFILAFKLPNTLRRFFAEGAFSQAFVPILSEYRLKYDKNIVMEFFGNIAIHLGLWLCTLSCLGIIFAPFLVGLFAPGFYYDADSTRLVLATEMLRITFPYIFFISMVALASSVLNTYGKFAASSGVPVILNLTLILVVLIFNTKVTPPEKSLAWGVLLAGLLQLLFIIIWVSKAQLLPKFKFNWQDAGVKRILKLMLPAIVGASVTQVNMLVDTVFASFLVTGSVSWLYYADRLMELPLGIFGIAAATVVLPSLSRAYASSAEQRYSKILDWGLRYVLYLGVAAAIGLYCLAIPLLASLFLSGSFTINDVNRSGYCLMGYSGAVIGIMLTKVLVSAFYARQNFKTPVKISCYMVLLNIILNGIFIKPLGSIGLALATSITSMLNAACLLTILIKNGYYVPEKNWNLHLIKLIFANVVMLVFLQIAIAYAPNWFDLPQLTRCCYLLGIIFSAALIYGTMLVVSGIKPKKILNFSI